jgi:hypothetical protein
MKVDGITPEHSKAVTRTTIALRGMTLKISSSLMSTTFKIHQHSFMQTAHIDILTWYVKPLYISYSLTL